MFSHSPILLVNVEEYISQVGVPTGQFPLLPMIDDSEDHDWQREPTV